MNKFKSGDMVVCKKEYKKDTFYFDTPKEIEGYSILGMALIGELESFMSEDYFELAPTPKLEVGDYVKSTFFEGIKKITRINNDNDTINVDRLIFAPLCEDCELVCGFTKGQEIEVAKGHGFIVPKKRIFNQYRPELEKPFECVMQDSERKFENNGLYNINTWKYAREIQPKYKAYTEPKLEWLKEDVCVKNKETGSVDNINAIYYENNTWKLKLSSPKLYSLQDMVNEFTWEDGKPCGELIK